MVLNNLGHVTSFTKCLHEGMVGGKYNILQLLVSLEINDAKL